MSRQQLPDRSTSIIEPTPNAHVTSSARLLRPAPVAAVASLGIAVVAGLSLGLSDQHYLRVLAVGAVMASLLAASEVRQADVVGWMAAIGVATATLGAVVATRIWALPGVEAGGARAGALVAGALAVTVLVAAEVDRRARRTPEPTSAREHL